MIQLMLAVVCLAQLAPLPYETATKQAEANDQPMLVIVESQSCPPCVRMKRDVLQPMAAAGELQGIIVARLEPGPVADWMGVKSTPSLVGFRKSNGEWRRYRMDGPQSIDRVRELVRRLRQ